MKTTKGRLGPWSFYWIRYHNLSEFWGPWSQQMGNPQTSWLPQTFVLLLSRMITSNTNSPALLSSSPFLPVCLMQTYLFFVILFFFSYIATSFVVTCVNKAGNKSIVLVSISGMALIKDIIVQGLGEYSNSLEKILRNCSSFRRFCKT